MHAVIALSLVSTLLRINVQHITSFAKDVDDISHGSILYRWIALPRW